MTVWEKFIENQGNEHVAREAFENLCQEILKKHFPGKTIVSVNKLDKTNEFKNLTVVFLPKFFVDSLTSSRKGQIRKGFNKTIEQAEEKNFKIFKWILCVPYKLTQTELQWWAQWKYKNFDQYNIDIELFDGDKIYSLAKQYNLSKLWLLETPVVQDENKDDEVPIEIVDFDESDNMERDETEAGTGIDKEQESEETKQETAAAEQGEEEKEVADETPEETKEVTPGTPDNQEKESTGQTDLEEKTEDITAEITQEEEEDRAPEKEAEKEPVPNTFKPEELEEFSRHKHYYSKVKEKIAVLSGEEKEKFEFLRKYSDFSHNKFDSEFPDNLRKEKVLQLFYQARSYEVDKQYDKALLYYEALKKRQEEVRKYLRTKLDDINKAINKINKRLVYENNILNGDYHNAAGSKVTALEFYEKALRIYSDSREANLKYYETFGDLLMSEGLFDKASDAYSKAKKFAPENKEYKALLKQKESIAHNLDLGKKVPVFGWIFRSVAKLNDKDTELIPEDENYVINKSTNSIIAFAGIAILVLILYFADIPSKASAFVTKEPSYAAADFAQIAMDKGDYYMDKYNRYGILRIHVVDSARDSYRRAMYYQPLSKEAKEKYEKANSIWKNYIEQAQNRIKKNPDKYFVSLRKEHEGLKLFKYKYDPNNPKLGKYGYVDTNMNIVIPPVYDFDYNKRIKPGKENFNAGRAIVCLASDHGDTLYFKIDRKGHRVSKIISLNKLKYRR